MTPDELEELNAALVSRNSAGPSANSGLNCTRCLMFIVWTYLQLESIFYYLSKGTVAWDRAWQR